VNGMTRVIILCCDGLYQRYLICRVAREYSLMGVILQSDPHAKGTRLSRLKRYKKPSEIYRYIVARLSFAYSYPKIRSLHKGLFYEHNTPPSIPADIPVLKVADINAPDAVEFIQTLGPDIVCVNGTNLLRKPILELIPSLPYKIINLHTGLSPYARGGNCNLFVLLAGHPEWVGITIHYIDSGIDSGNIIRTAQVDIKSDDCYQVIDAKSFKLGIDLMVASIRQLRTGKAPHIKQWARGKLFLKRTGYTYHPYLIVKVNRLIRQGLLSHYLNEKQQIDTGVKLVGDHDR